jgi:hypothetical protein
MDLVRYADTHGSEGDPAIPQAWRYRDYLIRAFNTDVPYDRFVREQLAGDLLPDPRVNTAEGLNESALGTGHFRMIEHGYQPVDTPLHVHDLHATILWLLGIDNMGLTYRYKGRPERPTQNEGEPYKKIVG